jgi:transposase-like protein
MRPTFWYANPSPSPKPSGTLLRNPAAAVLAGESIAIELAVSTRVSSFGQYPSCNFQQYVTRCQFGLHQFRECASCTYSFPIRYTSTTGAQADRRRRHATTALGLLALHPETSRFAR